MRYRSMFHRLTVAAVAIIRVAVITAEARRGVGDLAMQDLSSSDQLKQRLQQDSGKG